MPKLYAGIRGSHGTSVVVYLDAANGSYALSPRWDLFQYTKDDFSWGNRGSGASQLSLAILSDYFGIKRRVGFGETEGRKKVAGYMGDFRDLCIATLVGNNWVIHEQEVKVAISELDLEKKVRGKLHG